VAANTGKNPHELRRLLDGAKKQQSILDAITRPAESKTWAEYRPIFITRQRIGEGIAFYDEHRELLERVGAEYGVSPAYIAAILGVETRYGRITGHYKVLDALVTLAFYYPPREKFFRSELKTLLELPDNKLGGPLDTLTGSYAGAQGWGQFMPSSIKAYAVDADGDGHVDLHGSVPDIVASVANYFHAHGWTAGDPVATRAQPLADARPVYVKPSDRHASTPSRSLARFGAAGYVPQRQLSADRKAALLRLQAASGPEYWFTFHNFYVITRYNRSPLYAMAVHELADAIAAGARLSASPPDAGSAAP
jgi:membrane-bound lytic murein transglycosylase B